MARCQHCDKLTHSEDLIVFFAPSDYEKVSELWNLSGWTAKYNNPK